MITKLSIIVPIYNQEQYLPECLQAFERQDFDNTVEVLLIDDGSTDNSLQLCNMAAEKNGFYRVIHQENQGVAVARNTGLDNAKGEYIAWVDPDDYITDEWYRVVKDELSSFPDMIFFDMYMLYEDKVEEFVFAQYSYVLSNKELCDELSIGNKLQSHLCSKIIRRKFYDKRFSKKYSFGEDFSLLHHICLKVKTCRYVHEKLYVYRQVEGGLAHDKEKQLDNLHLLVRLYKQRFNFYKRNNIDVSPVGIFLVMLFFLHDYCIGNIKDNYKYKKIYKLYFKFIKYNLYKIAICSKVPFKRRLRIACIVFMGSNLYEIIMKLKYRKYLNDD